MENQGPGPIGDRPSTDREAPHFHSHAAIVSIGDELVRGQTLDTNSRLLSQRLMDLGIEPVEHVTVGDDRAAAAETLRRLAARAPLIVATGGLGPTADDLTREALADVLGEGLVVDGDALRDLEARFTARGRVMGENQRVQATRPASARCITNAQGTAPGLHAVIGRGTGPCDVYCLPGPPGELTPMFDGLVAPALRPEPGVVVRVRLLQVYGLGEGEAAARAGPLMDRQRNPMVGITASGSVLTWRIRYRGRGPAALAERAIEETAAELRAKMAPYAFAEGNVTLAEAVVRALTERGWTLAVVESCTGGLLGAELTAVPGSSAVFAGGWVTYSDRMKSASVGVRDETLARHGAVSAEVATEMALGGLRHAAPNDAGACVAITGIAGPGGGTPGKPVGTVYVCVATRATPEPGEGADRDPAPHPTRIDMRRFAISGTREDVRQRAARAALGMTLFAAKGHAVGEPRLLWEASNPA